MYLAWPADIAPPVTTAASPTSGASTTAVLADIPSSTGPSGGLVAVVVALAVIAVVLAAIYLRAQAAKRDRAPKDPPDA